MSKAGQGVIKVVKAPKLGANYQSPFGPKPTMKQIRPQVFK